MKRITQLDGVRGLAILMVLIWHYFNCQIVAPPNQLVTLCTRATGFTWSGVDLFFVLSGFLIAGILLDHRNTANFFRVFYLRRVCRIFPLYFLMLGLFVGLAAMPFATRPAFRWLFDAPLPIWSYASFTQNIFMGWRGDFGPDWLAVTWSLAVEEQFYLVIPFLIYFLPRRALVCVLVTAIIAAPVLRYASPGFHAFVDTPWRADSMLSGVLLAVLVRWQPFISRVHRRPGATLALSATLLAGTAAVFARLALFGVLNHLWLAGAYATLVLIAFAMGESWLGRLLKLPPLVWLGQLSYGIYMFHQAVSGLIHGVLRQRPAPQIHSLADAGITLAALGITLALAAVSFRFFEGPLLRFGHRFQYLPARPRTDHNP